MPFKGIPSLPPFRVGCSPVTCARQTCVFMAFADLPLDSVDTVAIGPKGDQFYCAFLCTIVQLEVCTSD